MPIVSKVWHGEEISFPVILDGDMKTADEWNISSFPSLRIIDPRGKLTTYINLKAFERDNFGATAKPDHRNPP